MLNNIYFCVENYIYTCVALNNYTDIRGYINVTQYGSCGCVFFSSVFVCFILLLFNIINTVLQINKCFCGYTFPAVCDSVKNIQLDYSKKLLHVACPISSIDSCSYLLLRFVLVFVLSSTNKDNFTCDLPAKLFVCVCSCVGVSKNTNKNF